MPEPAARPARAPGAARTRRAIPALRVAGEPAKKQRRSDTVAKNAASRPGGDPCLLPPFDTMSFASVWYWALTVLVWTLVTQRVLGVPHDMLIRAARLPEVSARVDTLAHIAAERVAGIADAAGVVFATLAGFTLAMLAVMGFLFQIELAKALAPLAFPLCLIAATTARLAARIRREKLRGEPLRRLLTRHRGTNQAVAIIAMFAATILAVTHPPIYFPR